MCLSPFVISTKRSAWRDLINAPFGASGKPQRSLDYARDDRGGKGTLEMTYYARDDMKKGARITANSFCQQSMND